MTREEIQDQYPDITTFYDDCDSAIIGVASRCGLSEVVCYDYDKLIEALKKTFFDTDLTDVDLYEMAVEWYNYNIAGGYIGEQTPIVVTQA